MKGLWHSAQFDLCEIYTFFVYFFVSAWGQYDVFTTCPAVYTLGQLTPIRCTIDSAKVTAAQCSVIVDTVQFYLTENGVESLVCSATYPPSTCTPASSGKKCECVKQEGDIFTFQFEFVPNSTDESEKLRCQVICLDSQNLNQGPACAGITFSKYPWVTEQCSRTSTDATKKCITHGIHVFWHQRPFSFLPVPVESALCWPSSFLPQPAV